MEKKYLNPLIDYTFKKIFGNEKHKEILIHFLNSLGIESQGHKIVDLRILDHTNEKRFKLDKYSVMDIKATLNNGELVNIEVQILPYEHMLQRTIYYLTKMYSDQLTQGDDYGKLCNTITVNVLGYNQFEHDRIHSVYHIRDAETCEKLGDFLEIHFIETQKIGKSPQKLGEDLKGWLLFLSNPENQRITELGKEVGEVGQAINLLEELSRSREERAIAEEREKAIRDELSFRKAELEKGLQKGLEKGLQKGLKIGREEEKYEIAKKLIHKGMDLSEVLEITGLSLKDLKNIGNLT